MIGVQTALVALFIMAAPAAAASIACGPSGTISQAGSTTVYPVVTNWATSYAKSCKGVKFVSTSGSSTVGAQAACGVAVSGKTYNVGLLSRSFKSTEATRVAGGNGYDYKCLIGTKPTVRLVPVALDGVAFSFPAGGDAAKCIAKLSGKGLTTDQLRFIFSNYTIAQLTASGWNKNSVANPNGGRKWSSISAACPNTAIAIAGSPSTSGTNTFVAGAIFKGKTEGFRTPYYSVSTDNPPDVVAYLIKTSNSIGYLGDHFYEINSKKRGVSPIKNAKGSYVAPSASSIAGGTYTPFTRYIYVGINLAAKSLVGPFVKFGATTSAGNSLTVAAGEVALSAADQKKVAAIL